MRKKVKIMGYVKWEWTVPNILSLFRILLIPVFVVLYSLSAGNTAYLYGAIGALLLSALSDFLDGIIARHFHQISELGKILDPLADKLTQIAVILCVTLRHSQLIWLLVICFIKEGLQTIGGWVLLSKQVKIEGSRWYGKITTALFYLTMAFIVVTDYWLTEYRAVTDLITVLLLMLLMVCMLLAFVGYFRVFLQLKGKAASGQKMPDEPGEKED